MNEVNSGEIVNLLANDAEKVHFAHLFFNHLWVCPGRGLRLIRIGNVIGLIIDCNKLGNG